MILVYALAGAFIVSLIAFLGLTTLALKEKLLNKILIYLVSFSAGGLMGGAFFHLMPEAIEESSEPINVFIYVLVGFGLFFLIERFLLWHHCHDRECKERQHLGYINLIGDAVHNTIDGIIIISSFLVSVELGIIVTLSIIFHEVPQELGDFGVLLYSGLKKAKALILNYFVAAFVIFGVIIGYFLINWIETLVIFLLPAAAGGFIYIAASDLIPELHKQTKTKQSIISFVIFVFALILMYGLKQLHLGH